MLLTCMHVNENTAFGSIGSGEHDTAYTDAALVFNCVRAPHPRAHEIDGSGLARTSGTSRDSAGEGLRAAAALWEVVGLLAAVVVAVALPETEKAAETMGVEYLVVVASGVAGAARTAVSRVATSAAAEQQVVELLEAGWAELRVGACCE